MKRADVVNNANIQPGDIIVGLASFGQASYETEYNGGMGSNGLTSARHDVLGKLVAGKYPESFDPAVPADLVYSGSKALTDLITVSTPKGERQVTVGKLILSPTRTYAPIMKPLLAAHGKKLHGAVHCSGGAQTKVLHFVDDNCHIVKDNLFPCPPLFELIQQESKTEWKEMYKVFNMGHRLELYVPDQKTADAIIALSRTFDVDARVVGRVERSSGKKGLTIKSSYGTFTY
jgi:phosphoribosylformylglycinamidine cyclo-ligase